MSLPCLDCLEPDEKDLMLISRILHMGEGLAGDRWKISFCIEGDHWQGGLQLGLPSQAVEESGCQ